MTMMLEAVPSRPAVLKSASVAEFARIDSTYVVPVHCTGEIFIGEAMRVMPDKIIRPYVGATFVFRA